MPELLNARLGQFFTPYEISRLNAELIMSDCGKIIEETGYITVSDPALGAGGMLIAAADLIEDRGFNPKINMWIHGVELSQQTFQMDYVQLSLRGLSGIVINGNSLTMEHFEQRYTPFVPSFYEAHGADALRRVVPCDMQAAA